MKNAVVGLGYGDEGKGRVVDWLCNKHTIKPDMVVRFSGGQQAAHNVYFKNTNHVFSNFSSGSIRKIPTYWGSHCTFDPLSFNRELKILQNKGINPVFYINPKCPITTPFETYYTQFSHTYKDHGTTGCGVGATWHREKKHYHLLFEDLAYPKVLAIKLNLIKKYYGRSFVDNTIREFKKICARVVKRCIISDRIPATIGKYILYEGSQGILLDQEHGFFPHVTRSKTDMTVLPYLANLYLVTRAYQTRHGNGPLSNELLGEHKIKNKYEANEESGTQGKFRSGILDVDMLQYAIMKSNCFKAAANVTLVITCLDVIKSNYKYSFNGKVSTCKDKTFFIQSIKDYLNINDILISEQPKGDLKKFKN